MDRSSPARTPRTWVVSLSLVAIVWPLWALGMALGDRWQLFGTEWFMSITMAFGSFIAGATSEGGGAVAFPVMTLLFKIPPGTARDFALMIQSVGMTAAALTIFLTGIPVERRAILWGSLGGSIGIVLGLEFVAGKLSPPYAKMLFVSLWLSFAFALFLINRYHGREVHREIQRFGPRQAWLLALTGVVGGVVTSITGSGLDITIFSMLVLRLTISEKIATPTSVVLMAGNALTGFAWKGLVMDSIAPAAWNYWWVCVPIVVLGAPFGAYFIKNRSRYFVAGLLYFSIAAQFIAALVILPIDRRLAGFSVLVFALGIGFFTWMARRGVMRLDWLARGQAGGTP